MKTDIHLYLAQLFLDWEMFQAKIVETIKHAFRVQELGHVFGRRANRSICTRYSLGVMPLEAVAGL
jgi:hypothetical protein